MDNCCNTDSSVAGRIGEQLHYGRVHSHPAGNCHYNGTGKCYSGAKILVIKKGFYPARLKDGKKD